MLHVKSNLRSIDEIIFVSQLLNQHDDVLINIEELALILDRKLNTVRGDVSQHPEYLPIFRKLGRLVRFRVGDVKFFLNGGECNTATRENLVDGELKRKFGRTPFKVKISHTLASESIFESPVNPIKKTRGVPTMAEHAAKIKLAIPQNQKVGMQ